MSRWTQIAVEILDEETGISRATPKVETVVIVETPSNGSDQAVSTVSTITAKGNREEIAERAAIVQEGAKAPAEWAEGFARLEATPIPPGVSHSAWVAMMNAAGAFLDQWGSHAAGLGWSTGELFGLDPNSPIGRRDRRGAAFYLAGAEVLAVSAETIAIKIGGAVQHIYRRNGVGPAAWGRVATGNDAQTMGTLRHD